MNPDMNPYGKKKKKPNKHPILIRLGIINTINTFFNIQVFHKMLKLQTADFPD